MPVGVSRLPLTPPLSMLASLNSVTANAAVPLLLRVITKVPGSPLATRAGLAVLVTPSGERTVMLAVGELSGFRL